MSAKAAKQQWLIGNFPAKGRKGEERDQEAVEGEMSLILEDYRDDQQQEPESAMNPPETFGRDQKNERKCYGEQ